MAEFGETDDWRSKCKNVTETYTEARRRAMFIDVRFLVGELKCARYFSAHKMILACGSPVFEAMFFGQLAEKKDPVTIPDDDPEAFEIMLRYLYGECIIFPSIVIACKSYSIGDKYLIPELQKKSASFISLSTMDDENFWGIIEGNLLTNKYIEEKFRSYIQLHSDRLLKSDEFLDVPIDIVQTALHMEELSISEFDLLTSVTKWCLKRFTKDTMWKTNDLLQHIRFSTLTPQEFCRFTEIFPDVLDSLTALKILKHLNDPNIYNLPFWCSTNKTMRKRDKAGLALANSIVNFSPKSPKSKSPVGFTFAPSPPPPRAILDFKLKALN